MSMLRYDYVFNKISVYKELLLSLFLFGLAADIFLFSLDSDIRKALLIALGLLIAKLYGFKSSVTFVFSLVFVVMLGVLYTLASQSAYVEKISTWLFVLLLVGVIQQFVELRRTGK